MQTENLAKFYITQAAIDYCIFDQLAQNQEPATKSQALNFAQKIYNKLSNFDLSKIVDFETALSVIYKYKFEV
jgi:hypothetical protein